jgi:hypothetical protein
MFQVGAMRLEPRGLMESWGKRGAEGGSQVGKVSPQGRICCVFLQVPCTITLVLWQVFCLFERQTYCLCIMSTPHLFLLQLKASSCSGGPVSKQLPQHH